MTEFVHPLDTLFDTADATPLRQIKSTTDLPATISTAQLPAVLSADDANVQFEADFAIVREKMLDAMDTVESAMSELSAISQSAQDPKGFAVVSELANSLATLSKTLMSFHKSRNGAETSSKSSTATMSPVSVENAVFVGSTADLMSMRAAK